MSKFDPSDRSVFATVNIHINKGAKWHVLDLPGNAKALTATDTSVSLYFDDLETARQFRRYIEAIEVGLETD